jgi:hypothetical protein
MPLRLQDVVGSRFIYLFTSIASYRLASGKWSGVSLANVTTVLRVAVVLQRPSVGFLPKGTGANALRAGGAMTLMWAQVDTYLIQLLGRWRSDGMLRYLNVQAQQVMCHSSCLMVQDGRFPPVPGQPSSWARLISPQAP